MKSLAANIFIILFWMLNVSAQSPVTIEINTGVTGDTIPENFSGVSFGTRSIRYGVGKPGGHFFDSTNTTVITLFKELGIKNLRIGGTSVDTSTNPPTTPGPTHADIDALFRFAKKTGVKIIYSLRLLNGNQYDDASTAKYIWDNYKEYLDYFAIGNEPNLYKNMDPEITNFGSYLNKWQKFALAIRDSAPSAKFGGPDGGSGTGGANWGTNFASYNYSTSFASYIYFHNYVGGSSKDKTVQQLVDEMLSSTWTTAEYPAQYNCSGKIVISMGYPYRNTEANSYYTGGTSGVWGGSNCFATALYALDYMHWWSQKKCQGVNFHTSMWKYNGTFYPDGFGGYQIYPIGYGIKAFDLGCRGNIKPVTLTNPDGINITAYAVGNSNSLYVTTINKEHGPDAKNAEIKIAADGFSPKASVIYLSVPGGNAEAMTGITLGGAEIKNNGPWEGKWSSLDSASAGVYYVPVPAASAAIVKIDNTSTSILEYQGVPEKFSLQQNFPNPFNSNTIIRFSIPESWRDPKSAGGQRFFPTSLKVYNMLGKEVATLIDEFKEAGNYEVKFCENDLASGIYIYRLKVGNISVEKKMELIK